MQVCAKRKDSIEKLQMCADVDCCRHLYMKNTLQYDRRNSWTNSTSSSSSSTTTSSWFERKLFNHFKRFFRRKSSSLTSNSSLSSRRPSSTTDDILSSPVDEEPQQEVEATTAASEVFINNENPSPPPPPLSSPPIDLLYDYDRLLARCLQRQEHDRTEMILRCQTPISIPHADLLVGQSRTIVQNWKSYVRLFRALIRDPHLFEQYLNEYFSCRSSINTREQLTLTIRTNKTTFDHILRKFLDEYVTCLICQTAQTHLIKSDRIWRIECQLCGKSKERSNVSDGNISINNNYNNNNNHQRNKKKEKQ